MTHLPLDTSVFFRGLAPTVNGHAGGHWALLARGQERHQEEDLSGVAESWMRLPDWSVNTALISAGVNEWFIWSPMEAGCGPGQMLRTEPFRLQPQWLREERNRL